MGLIKINGINLNVDVQGEGHPIILLHGVGGEQTQLANIAGQLAANFKVITMDCRGHGQSDKPEHYKLQDHVADVLGIINHFGITSAFLNGISMGSYIAQGVAIAEPERISKLILTVPKSNGLTSSIRRLMTDHAKELVGLSQHEAILTLLKYFTYDAEAMKAHVNLFETNLTPAQFYAASMALSGFDFRNDLPKVTAKTLVISGKYDGLNPPGEGKVITSLIPDANFIEMQYSGHAPMVEEPEAYIKIVKDFLLN